MGATCVPGSSVNDQKSTVRLAHCRRQPPDRHAVSSATLGGWLAVLAKNLPGQSAALLPAGTFGPSQQYLSLGVGGQGRVPAFLPALGECRLGKFERTVFDLIEANLTFSFRGDRDTGIAFGNRTSAHWTGLGHPLIHRFQLKARGLIA